MRPRGSLTTRPAARSTARLVTEADAHTDEAHRRELDLIDQIADARAELAAMRCAAVWARLYHGFDGLSAA